MEVTPYRIIDEPLLLYRYVACLVLEDCFLVPFALEGVLAADCVRVPELAVE